MDFSFPLDHLCYLSFWVEISLCKVNRLDGILFIHYGKHDCLAFKNSECSYYNTRVLLELTVARSKSNSLQAQMRLL